MRKIFSFFCLLQLWMLPQLSAEINSPLHIAVASNFLATMKTLVAEFKSNTNSKIVLSSGSSGKLYTQILQGAPFHIFFSADSEKPRKLEKKLSTLHRFEYARGRLVIWSPHPNLDISKIFYSGDYNRIAVAHPLHAPYGIAAKEFLIKQKLWEKIKNKIIRGENIAQAFQFVSSQNTELGILAFSQVKDLQGSFWMIPSQFHTPITQEVILTREHPAAAPFLKFIQSKKSRQIIEGSGYHVSN